MQRRVFIRNTAMASLALTWAGCDPEEDFEKILQKAGNTSDHGQRFMMLTGLKDSEKVPDAFKKDLEVVWPYAQTWAWDSRSAEYIEDERLKQYYLNALYSKRIRNDLLSPESVTELDRSSPLYPLYALYAGLAIIYHTIQISDIRMVRHLREQWYGKGRELLKIARKEFPDNQTLGIYFNEPVPWPNPVQDTRMAPEWATFQREGLVKLNEIIEWWINHRQLSDGTYGGGLNDDCEMWRWWKAILLGFNSPGINEAQEKLSRVTLDRPELELGYTSRMTDVEHSSEETSDVITPMMHLDPDHPEWEERVKAIFQLVRSKWSGRNQRGFLQFKTSYFSSRDLDMSAHRTCDTFYHFRLMQPLLLYWQRTGDKEIGNWVMEWLKTWVDAALSTDRGKPAGIVPSAIYWPSGIPGGINEEWWTPGNYSSPIYDWPGKTEYIYSTLVQAYHLSGDRLYLQPLILSAKLRKDYIHIHGTQEMEWIPGTEEWCGAMLGGMLGPALLKYRLVSDDRQFDELSMKDAGGYARLLLSGDLKGFTQELGDLSRAFSHNKEIYTGEVRNTDRVLAYPDYYHQFFYNAPSSRRLAGLLYQSLTGDAGYQSYFPLNAVQWDTAVGDIASVVTRNQSDRLEMLVLNFSNRTAIRIRTKILSEGTYDLQISSEGGTVITKNTIPISGSNARVELLIPTGMECRVIISAHA